MSEVETDRIVLTDEQLGVVEEYDNAIAAAVDKIHDGLTSTGMSEEDAGGVVARVALDNALASLAATRLGLPVTDILTKEEWLEFCELIFEEEHEHILQEMVRHAEPVGHA